MDPVVAVPQPSFIQKHWKKFAWGFLGVLVLVAIVLGVVYGTQQQEKPKAPPPGASKPQPPEDPSKLQPPEDTSKLQQSNCPPTSNKNLVRNGTFGIPEMLPSVDVGYGNVTYWDVSTGTDQRVGVVSSEAPMFGLIKAPGAQKQYMVMQTDGAYVTQKVTGFQVNCKYYLNIMALARPTMPTGMLTAYLDESVTIMPETIIPPKNTPGAFVTYGPYEFTATRAAHQLKILHSGNKAQGPLLSVLIGNVSITSSASPPLPNID